MKYIIVCVIVSKGGLLRLDQNDAEEAADDADQDSPDKVAVRVLTQDEACAADHAAGQDAEAEPESGVEGKDEGERQQCADDSSRCGGVGTDLDPVVDNGTDDLDGKRTDDDAEGELRNVQPDEQIEQGNVAGYADNVRHETAFTLAHLMTGPTVDLTVKHDAEVGQEYREQIDDTGQNEFGDQRQEIEVAEREKQDEAGDGEIERREYE